MSGFFYSLYSRILGTCTEISYVDSKTLPVCHINREKQNKVFKGLAHKSKSTMGWYYSFIMHMIKNDKDHYMMSIMTKEVFGSLFGDRRYMDQKLAEYLWNEGFE